jgi:hypothetical protein
VVAEARKNEHMPASTEEEIELLITLVILSFFSMLSFFSILSFFSSLSYLPANRSKLLVTNLSYWRNKHALVATALRYCMCLTVP